MPYLFVSRNRFGKCWFQKQIYPLKLLMSRKRSLSSIKIKNVYLIHCKILLITFNIALKKAVLAISFLWRSHQWRYRVKREDLESLTRYRHWWERHEKLMAKTAFFKAILKFCTTNKIFVITFNWATASNTSNQESKRKLIRHVWINTCFTFSFSFFLQL